MKLRYSILMTLVVLCGCANVDPSAANRERNRQVASAAPAAQLHCEA
jgi:hypothetical protein